ncbi:MAG: tRNA modification GTPase [Planctomycetota bacterium]|mgnify:CR=1 FL=1
MDTDTIIAIATPIGPSLKAIIRLSGPESFRLIKKVFTRTRSPATGPDSIRTRPLTSFLSYSAVDGYINIKIPIPATLYLMKSPYSYTKEDIVEIHTIGTTPLLDSILSYFIQCGVRLAQPGEFTKRAFLNGRIDLTQAEAVLKLIRAGSDQESRLALNSLTGRFARQVKDIQQQLVDLISRLELNLDFSDQEIEIITPQTVRTTIETLINNIHQILQSSKKHKIFKDGIIAVICGRPNTGKSSLFNRLVPDKKTIVTTLAGTTRDMVEGKCLTGQTLFRIRDTAGIIINPASSGTNHAPRCPSGGGTSRETSDLSRPGRGKSALMDKIKKITVQSFNEADLFILVLDGSRPLTLQDKTMALKATLVPDRTIVLLNKNDLTQRIRPEMVRKFFNKPPLTIVSTSSKTGKGIEHLKTIMVRLSRGSKTGRFSNSFLINTRQENHLKQALLALEKAEAIVKKTKVTDELLTIDLREALDQTGAIVGQVVTDDILNHIFAEFCIGK